MKCTFPLTPVLLLIILIINTNAGTETANKPHMVNQCLSAFQSESALKPHKRTLALFLYLCIFSTFAFPLMATGSEKLELTSWPSVTACSNLNLVLTLTRSVTLSQYLHKPNEIWLLMMDWSKKGDIRKKSPSWEPFRKNSALCSWQSHQSWFRERRNPQAPNDSTWENRKMHHIRVIWGF